MTGQVIPARFALRRRTAAAWAALNEVLHKGEPGVEIDTGFGKSGDGTTPWNELPYELSGHMDMTGLTDGKCMAWDASRGLWTPANRGAVYQPGLGVDIDDTDPEAPVISSTLGSIHIDGRVATYGDLPAPPPSGVTTYYVEADQLIYIWDGSAWPDEDAGVSLRPAADPFEYATTCLIQPAISGLLDRARPGRWSLFGDATMDPITGINFGTSGYLYSSVPELVGAGDFTVEGVWVPSSVSGTRELFAWSNVSQTGTGSIFSLFCEVIDGKIRASLRSSSASNVDVTTASSVVSAGSEHHISVSASGATFYVWVDGVNVVTAAIVGTRALQQSNLRLGQLAFGDLRQFSGELLAFRVTSGVARYTSSFSPPPLPWP